LLGIPRPVAVGVGRRSILHGGGRIPGRYCRTGDDGNSAHQAKTFTAAPRAHRWRGPVVLLPSSDLEVLAQTPETQKYLRVRSPAERAALFARAYGLSDREIELMGHRVTGTDTRDLANRMFVSQHTVQDHLKSIFAKTSMHSRRELLSRALDTHSPVPREQ
jgi:DNA-binding CsgD family transcriptional regulator